MHRFRLALASLAFAAPLAVTWAIPQDASACGGTFCDGGPQAMPVDQTGENILFVMGENYTEAHIQIQYDPTTEANGFAWVVPLTQIPEFSVGSEILFQNMLAGTVPSYGFQTNSDDCSAPNDNPAPPSAGGDGGADASFDAGGGMGPEVVLRDTVGAFEIVVLSGGTAEEVMTWLGDNGYQQDPKAEPILGEYLAEGFMFAAFKLSTAADVSEIHPVVLRFENSDEACIPLRLTRIAASDDMDIRAFFLSDNRVVPRNYRHVLVNPLKLDWPNQASNYKEVITMAVDAGGADGHAFVTEFAGDSTAVGEFGIFQQQWNAPAFTGLDAEQAIGELQNQGFVSCFGAGYCEFGHPLIRGLMDEYLPAPDGVDPIAFYDCPACYIDQFDAAAWNPMAFANDLQERIIDPGQHAIDLLDSFPYMTRMYTTISGGEMTLDPLFHQNASLPDVTNSRLATRRILCNGDAVWTLPDGREVYLPAGDPWPEFPGQMPWEEEIAEVADAGAPMFLAQRTDEINALLLEYNTSHGWPGIGSADDGGDGGSGDDGSTGGDSAGIGDGAGDNPRSSEGCGCRAGDTRWPTWSALLGLVVLGRVRRRPGRRLTTAAPRRHTSRREMARRAAAALSRRIGNR